MGTELPGDGGGVWLVGTASSTYVVDLDRGTLTRYPGRWGSTGGVPVAVLRRDGVELPLLGVVGPVRVGSVMDVLVDVRGDGVATWRRSTEVRSIEPVLFESAP